MDERELDGALEPLRRLLGERGTFVFGRQFIFSTKNKNQTEVHIMASIDFENLKQKLTEAAKTVAEKTTAFAKDVADKSSDAARSVAEQTKTAAKKTKLNMEISAQRGALKEKYTELGKLYYEKYAGSTDPDFSDTVAAIEASLEAIETAQAQIDALGEHEDEEPDATVTEEPAEEKEEPAEDTAVEVTVEETVEDTAEDKKEE